MHKKGHFGSTVPLLIKPTYCLANLNVIETCATEQAQILSTLYSLAKSPANIAQNTHYNLVCTHRHNTSVFQPTES